MSIGTLLSRLGQGLQSLFFPDCCLYCGKLLDDNQKYLCDSCLQQLPLTEMNMHKFNLAEQRIADQVNILRAASYCRYEHESEFRKMIHRAKYGNRPEIMYRLAQQAAIQWLQSGYFNDVDVIIPVPLHNKKKRYRGYNQSDYIARGLGETLGLKVCYDGLMRLRNDKSQTMQTNQERQTNIVGAFTLNPKHNFEGKTVMLVDDVLTTGATLVNCAKQFGKKTKIVIFTLAISI